MSVVVGIDPGAQGAIAFVDGDTGELLMVEDMPVDKIQRGKHVRSRVARQKLLDILLRAKGASVFAEQPEGRPMRSTNRATGQTEMRTPGAAGMLSLGENYGCVLMGCTAAGMSLTEVRPGKWKSAVSVPASKDEARRRASEVWPAWADKFARKKDDGRSEAALVALYGSRVLKGRIHAEAST